MLDINLQRLNPFVLEAEIFERVVRITSLKTLIKFSLETGKNYGQEWSSAEYDILNFLEKAFQKGILKNSPSLQKFINENFGKLFSEEEIKLVLSKLELSVGKVMLEEVPYLKEGEYKNLIDHQKRKKKKMC